MRSESSIRQKLERIERLTNDPDAALELGPIIWGIVQCAADSLKWALADEVPSRFQQVLDLVDQIDHAHERN